jgi:ankyrin repeat protein
MTALHMIAAKGNLELIDKLLAMGADIDAKDADVRPHHLNLPHPAFFHALTRPSSDMSV